jgi:hypothetical protein
MRIHQLIERQKKFQYILGTATSLNFPIVWLTPEGMEIGWPVWTVRISTLFLFVLCLEGGLKLRVSKEAVKVSALYFAYYWMLVGVRLALINEIVSTLGEFYYPISLNSPASWCWEDSSVGNLWVF